MTGKTSERSVSLTSPCLLKSKAKLKGNGNAFVKRSVWVDLDLSTFKVVFSPSIQHGRCCSVDQAKTKRKLDNKLRRVSWESGAMQYEVESTKKSEIPPPTINHASFTYDLVQTLMNRHAECRTVDQSSRFIQFPHDHDVIMGRGIGTNKHPGNLALRIFCWNARDAYTQGQREHKPSVVASVIRNVFDRTPPGRFLEMEKKGRGYVDVPLTRVYSKIGSSLRECKWLPPFESIELLGLQKYGQRPPVVQDQTLTQHPPSIHCVAPSVMTAAFEAEESLAPLDPANAQQATVNMIDPSVLPNTRVAVYWPGDDAYYEGRVLERMHNCVSLLYDDGESEWIDLSKHKYRVLEAASPSLPIRPTTVIKAAAILA